MRNPTPALLALVLAVPLAGCALGPRGLDSVHQPVVVGDTATVPGCPDWDHEVGGMQERQSSNFGCAFNTNIAAMVADPNDLLHGRSDATPAEPATRAVKAWREVEPTYKAWKVTTTQSTTGGK